MNSPVTLVITDHVPLEQQTAYETLVGELHIVFNTQGGFLSADTVRHRAANQIEYTVLLRFADEVSAKRWRSDETIRNLLAQIEVITGGAVQAVEVAGLGIWADHAARAAEKLPPYWKRVVLSVLGVYPMLIGLLAATAPFTADLPQPLAVLAVVIILACLLTWPIMPWLGRTLGPWLVNK